MPASLMSLLDSKNAQWVNKNEMLRRIRDFDWGNNALGPLNGWPSELRSAARTMLLSSVPITVLAGDKGIVLYNDAVAEMFGSHYDGALGLSIFDVLPDAEDFYRAALTAAFEGRPCKFLDEPLKLHRNGELRTGWFNLAFVPIANEHGDVFGTLLLSAETTEHVRAIRDLERERQRLELALSAGEFIVQWELDVHSNLATFDVRLADLLGVDAKDAIRGVSTIDLFAAIHSDDRELVKASLAQAIATGSDCKCRYRARVANGSWRWFISSGRPVRDDEGNTVRLLGVMIDVTDQAEVAAALAESKLRFDTLAETVPQIVWSTDGNGRHDYFNGRWHEFTGLPAGETGPESWISLVHPDDWPLVVSTWKSCFRSGKSYDVDYRFRHRSGEFRWLRVMALPMRNSNGEIVRWFGTSTDIHDTKRLEIERALVAQELDHRIKNLFAIVNGLVSLSVRDAPQFADIANNLRERLTALHDAHGLIRANEQAVSHATTASLHALIRAILKPYMQDVELNVQGEDVEIDRGAITPLALILHELATNSIKYGAIHDKNGLLKIQTRRQRSDAYIYWVEQAHLAQEDEANKEKGFGSKLLTMTIEQLRGRLERNRTNHGISVKLSLPLTSLNASRAP